MENLFWRQRGQDFSEANFEDSVVVHFSGEVEMWHRILVATSSKSEDQRREVSHALAATNGEDGGGEDVTQHNLEDYRDHGCRREGQRISKDACGREGHHSCLGLDGAKGARGSCASHKGLARMLRQVCGVCFLWKSSKTTRSRRLFRPWNSCGSELDDGTRQPCDCEMVAGPSVGAP